METTRSCGLPPSHSSEFKRRNILTVSTNMNPEQTIKDQEFFGTYSTKQNHSESPYGFQSLDFHSANILNTPMRKSSFESINSTSLSPERSPQKTQPSPLARFMLERNRSTSTSPEKRPRTDAFGLTIDPGIDPSPMSKSTFHQLRYERDYNLLQEKEGIIQRQAEEIAWLKSKIKALSIPAEDGCSIKTETIGGTISSELSDEDLETHQHLEAES